MKPIKRPESNRAFRGGDGIDPLPAMSGQYKDGSHFIESCWQATLWERIKVALTGRIYVQVLGTKPPPMHVATHSDSADRICEHCGDVGWVSYNCGCRPIRAGLCEEHKIPCGDCNRREYERWRTEGRLAAAEAQ